MLYLVRSMSILKSALRRVRQVWLQSYSYLHVVRYHKRHGRRILSALQNM